LEFPGSIWVSDESRFLRPMLTPLSVSQPLHLSSFTLDEFEHAIRHSVADPPCSLLAEVHSTLIYNLRTVSFQRHSAVRSMLQYQDKTYNEDDDSSHDDGDQIFGVSVEQLSAAMADVGNNWERAPLRASEGRDGWEDSLVGCLKDVSKLRRQSSDFCNNFRPLAC
jgi:bromodomain adjacent to zinc finger domain protein 1A